MITWSFEVSLKYVPCLLLEESNLAGFRSKSDIMIKMIFNSKPSLMKDISVFSNSDAKIKNQCFPILADKSPYLISENSAKNYVTHTKNGGSQPL